MIAGSTTSLIPTLLVDPVDHLLVDVATGRYLRGDTVHAGVLAREHGFDRAEAVDLLDASWCLGIVSRPSAGSAVVTWSPEASQVQLQRLARVMVAAVGTVTARDPYGVAVIDGEETRLGAAELFSLGTPCDVDLFLEVARALLSRRSIAVLDELVSPLAILFSRVAQEVHGFQLAASDDVRAEIVRALVLSLMDGRVDAFKDLVADYVVAMSID